VPLRGARIHLLSDAAVSEPALTDDQGRFEMRVPAQRPLRIRVAKAGFVTQIVTSSRAPGQLDVMLPRAAVLEGRVLTASGEPLVATVSVERSGGGEPPDSTRPSFFTQTTSNDLGEFRLSGLPVGQYLVKTIGFQSSVTLQRGEESSLAIVRPEPTQSASPQSMTSEVARQIGESGVVVTSGPGNSSVRGRVVGSDQQPLAGVHLSLTALSSGALVQIGSASTFQVSFSAPVAAVFSDAQGRYQLPGIPAGRYQLALTRRGYALSTTDANAPEMQITIGDGERREMRDLVLRKTGSISGRITGPLGLPVRGIMVRATSGQTMTSAADGRYELTNVPPGGIRVAASSSTIGVATTTGSGSVTVLEGTSRLPVRSATMTLGEGQRIDGVDLVLQPRRAIAGTVVDANGDPVEGLLMQALDSSPTSARIVSLQTRTDDKGRYRLRAPRPGTFYVMAVDDHPVNDRAGGTETPPGARRYYPGRASFSEAQPIRVSAQSDSLGVDFVFAPAPGAGIRGFAFQSSGEPARGTAHLMVRSRTDAPTLELQRVSIGQGGSFEFLNVPRGDYVVQIIGGSTLGSMREYGVQPLTIDGTDTRTLVVQTVIGSTIAGHVLFEGEPPSPSAGTFKLTVAPDDPSRTPVGLTPRTVISSSWIFEVSSLFGPARIAASAPDGWWLQSIHVERVNVADTPFDFGTAEQTRSELELVFASGAATVAGRVLDAKGQPVVDATAIVFPADATSAFSSSQYVRVLRSGADGSFSAPNLRPGEYLAVAIDTTADDMRDPRAVGLDRLNAWLPFARHVTADRGQRQSVDLTLVENVD